MTPGRETAHRARPYLWTLGLLWLLPILLVLAGHLLLPDTNADGQCEGIGFGCVPAPSDGVVILGLVASPFLAIAGGVAATIIAVVQARRDRHSAANR